MCRADRRDPPGFSLKEKSTFFAASIDFVKKKNYLFAFGDATKEWIKTPTEVTCEES